MANDPIRISLESAAASSRDDGDVMARFHFGADIKLHHDLDQRVALEPLLDQTLVEVWRHPGPHVHRREDHIAIVSNADYTLFSMEIETSATQIEEAASTAYHALLDAVSRHGSQAIVKAWNIIPEINRGEGDAEVYKRFCVGRSRAFDRFGISERSIPAGTGVGSATGAPLQIFLLTAASVPSPIENPRQISAYRYPRRYGPRSPTFARAALINGNGAGQLFLSGTAAIVGHESQAAGDPATQAATTLMNLKSLIRAARPDAATPMVGALRVYVRHPEDAAIAQAAAQQLLDDGNAVLVLRADICRRELLIEIDGIAYFPNGH